MLAGVAVVLIVGAIVTLIGAALIERAHPPRGRFVEFDGLRQHVVDIGGTSEAPNAASLSFSFTAPAAISKICGSRLATICPGGG